MTKTDSPLPPKTLGDKSRGTLNNDLLMDLDNITFDLQNTHSTEAKYNRCTQIVKADYWQLRTKPDIEVVTAEHWKKTDFGNLMKIHSLSVAQPEELQEPEVPIMGGGSHHVELVVNQKKGISVKGGKKGKGLPCMTVMSLRDYFKNLSKTKNLSNVQTETTSSPKRKLKENFSSPSKKQRFMTKYEPGGLKLDAKPESVTSLKVTAPSGS